MEPFVAVAVLLAVFTAFAVSASAGFGGSLILVPALALVLDTKSGVALAAILLAGNNIVKLYAYRGTLPFRQALGLIVVVAIASAVGAQLLVAAPEGVVTIAVIIAFGAAFVGERLNLKLLRRVEAPLLAAGAGITSGFSGTSGPLKGLAVRALELDRAHIVGALSLLSLAGDVSKAAVFSEAGLITTQGYYLAIAAVPLMITATFLGRKMNRKVGERGYSTLFWVVMAGYTARLVMG
jgi:uncharacterized membrane protein YfcA